MTGGDELAKRRMERTQHPSTMPPIDAAETPIAPDESYAMSVDDLPSMVRARLEALQGIVAEVIDELELRGVDDLADRLRGALP